MKFIKLIILITFTFTAIWCGGFVWFMLQLDNVPDKNITSADAIIVLTGGSKRVDAGLELLNQQEAPILFISGAGKGVTIDDIYRSANVQQPPHGDIVIGHQAVDTKGNAQEIAKWVENYKLESFILVTSNYHIERAALEISKVAGDINIIKYPVISNNIKTHQWWNYQKSRDFIIKEYNKLLAASLGMKRH